MFSFAGGGALFRQNLTLNLNDAKSSKAKKPFGTLDLHGLTDAGNLSSRSSGGISFNAGGFNRLNMALIDDTIPLERQGYVGAEIYSNRFPQKNFRSQSEIINFMCNWILIKNLFPNNPADGITAQLLESMPRMFFDSWVREASWCETANQQSKTTPYRWSKNFSSQKHCEVNQLNFRFPICRSAKGFMHMVRTPNTNIWSRKSNFLPSTADTAAERLRRVHPGPIQPPI